MATTSIDIPARYADARRIGRGGMGEILLARDTDLDREVVVKVLRPEFAADHDVARRFRREARAAARLSGHPHVVAVHDVGEHDERPYIVMEHVPGGTVADRLRAGPVDRSDAVRWIGEAAEAIDAAHQAGIVHRDVKPGNLLLDSRGRVRVGDFGIARAIDSGSVTQTAPGTVLGTAGYLSPEQATGAEVGPASDRYALAVVAFELLAGRRPFQRDSFAAEAAAHVHDPVPTIDETPALDDVFARALAKHPEGRYPTAAAFADALAVALDAPRGLDGTVAVASTPTHASRYAAGTRRNVLLVVGLLALLAFVALAIADDDDQPARSARTPSTAPATTTEPADTVTRAEAIAMHERAFELIQQERFADALPLATRALRHLQGVAPWEAYANYNVGYSLLRLGRCAEAIPYLDRSEQLQGTRREIDAAQREAERCVSGGSTEATGKPDGKARGKGKKD